MGVTFRVLGTVEASMDGMPLPIPSGKLSTLLAGLLVRANRTVPVEQLTRWLWDGDEPDPHRAKATVQEYVRRLRRTLGSDELVRTAPGGYLITADDDSLDLLHFRTLAARGRSAAEAGELSAAAERLTSALDLWRGPAVANVSSQALHDDEIAHLTEQHLVVSEQWAEAMLAIGEHERAIPELRKLTGAHPLRERLWEHLILAGYRANGPAEALVSYEQLRAVLADNLGVDPSPALRRLHQAILTNDPSLDPPPARPLPTAPPPQQLPADINHFTGRAQDLSQLRQLIAGPDDHTAVIAAIEGTAGVGKTTLAVHFGHLAAKGFPDGRIYLNLRGYGPGELIPPDAALATLLSALGTHADRLPADLDARAALWRTRTYGRRILVVLDNVRDTRQVRPLLPGPGCLVLITSRAQLRGLVARDGARRIVLDRLDPPEALSLLASVVGEDRITAEPAAAHRIIDGCARLPLAVRILGERISRNPAVKLTEVADQIDSEQDRLAMFDLQDDEETNLFATLMHSYRSLDVESARLFRLLGAQPVIDFSPAAAAATAGRDGAVAHALLEKLVSAHMLERRRSSRYQFHDLMREFAGILAHRLDGDDAVGAASRRLLDWYLHSMIGADWQLNPLRKSSSPYPVPDDVRPLEFESLQAALAWLDDERANLVSVSSLAPARGADRQVAWFARELFNYLVTRGTYSNDTIMICRNSLEASRRLGLARAEAFSFNGLGVCHSRLNEPAEAFSCFTNALTIWREVGDRFRERQVLGNLSTAHERNGDYQEAIRYGMRSLEIARDTGESKLIAIALGTLGNAYLKVAQYQQAITYAQGTIDLVQGPGTPYIVGEAFRTIGNASFSQGDAAQGAAYFERALQAFRELGMEFEESETLIELGDALDRTGNPTEARRAWQRALAPLVAMRHPRADEVLDRLATSADRHPHPQRG